MKLKPSYQLILLFASMLFIFTKAVLAKDVCRFVEGTWDKIDNPYNVTCSLLVPEGKTLTIN